MVVYLWVSLRIHATSLELRAPAVASRDFIARPSVSVEPVDERDVPLGPRERGRVVAVDVRVRCARLRGRMQT